MTLFSSIRGTPTLSLKGGVRVPLFLFLFVFLQINTTSLWAQNLKNRTEEMHHFGTVIIAKEPLPDDVYAAQKIKFLISVIFLEKGTSNALVASVGTGFLTESPGVIVTARHILTESLADVEKIKAEQVKLNPKFDFDRMFMGTIITKNAWVNFPLSLAATGELGTFKDIMALKVGVEIMEKAHDAGDVLNPNPYRVLLKTSQFSDAEIGEEVYISGFAPIIADYPGKKNTTSSAYMDLLNYTFLAETTARITNMPINKAGIQMIYRLHDSAEPGFSGGIVLNNKGQVIGMTMAMSESRNFVYVISSKDVKQFLKDNKLK